VGANASKIQCLFWNLNRRNRTNLLCQLVSERNIDIIVLAECGDHGKNLKGLKLVDGDFLQPASEIEKLQILVRNPSFGLNEVYADVSKRLTIRSLKNHHAEILFVAVHLVDNQAYDKESQAAEVRELAHQLRETERERGHSRTLLVGDLNMNPFDPGVVQAGGFHGVMTKSIAMKGNREVLSREYPFFYNPMWGFFGDRTPGPPGTHYFRGKHVSFEWNIYDQVLIRPDAIKWLDDTIEIIDSVGEVSLLTKQGLPNRNVGSDHLPLIFGLTFPIEEIPNAE
jgi:hypothetical protein